MRARARRLRGEPLSFGCLRASARLRPLRWRRAVEWKSPKPVAVGSRIAFLAQFLGRRLAYTYEVKELVPSERLVMRTADGPFPMETTYTWTDAGDGTTMTLRNRGEPAGFSRLVAPIMATAVRRANRKDLARLKAILEGRTSTTRT